MTTFTSTRIGVLGRLLAFPAIVMAFAARAAAAEFRTEFGALRTDFMPAVRYVITGNPEVNLVSQARTAVRTTLASVRDSIATFFRNHMRDRLLALFFLLMLPVSAIIVVGSILRDEDFFFEMGACIKALFGALVYGRDVENNPF